MCLTGNRVFAVWLNLAVPSSCPGSGPHRQVHGDLAGLSHPCLIPAGSIKILLLIPIIQ
jgi:hypothetical protein